MTSMGGSSSPVGRTTCSATTKESPNSNSLGVAETNMKCGALLMYSSNIKGLLSSAEGSLKPWSTSTSFRLLSPAYIPLNCESET